MQTLKNDATSACTKQDCFIFLPIIIILHQLEFITSKGISLPKTVAEMEATEWFNMWGKRNFPYRELLEGDVIYWLDTKRKRLTWKTEVIKVERYPYSNKAEIWKRYHHSMKESYYAERADSGYFLHYQVRVLDQVDILQPKFDFDQLGWERMDHKKWFGSEQVQDNTTIDNIVDLNKSQFADKLMRLNEKMLHVSPERIETLIKTTLRKDTHFISVIKEAADFKCQFPQCGHQIKNKKGGFYIEVAHINAVHKGGQSVLGNLIALCPNHHKEFDYGDLKIKEQTPIKLSGWLNGRYFEINLDLNTGLGGNSEA